MVFAKISNLFKNGIFDNFKSYSILGRKVAELLLQNGANVSAVQPRYYNTVLNWAAKTGE